VTFERPRTKRCVVPRIEPECEEHPRAEHGSALPSLDGTCVGREACEVERLDHARQQARTMVRGEHVFPPHTISIERATRAENSRTRRDGPALSARPLAQSAHRLKRCLESRAPLHSSRDSRARLAGPLLGRVRHSKRPRTSRRLRPSTAHASRRKRAHRVMGSRPPLMRSARPQGGLASQPSCTGIYPGAKKAMVSFPDISRVTASAAHATCADAGTALSPLLER